MASKKSLFEKFINELKLLWKTAPRGIILWNLFIVALLTVSAFYNVEFFIFAQVIGSFFAFAIMLENDLQGHSSAKNLWTLATVFTWIIFVFMIVFGILQFTYRWTFGYLIEQDERRIHLHNREELKKKYQHLMLEQGKTEETKLLSDGEKNNQKLLGN